MNRDLARALLNLAAPARFGRCSYCGHRCYGRACAGHKDLPQLENEGPAPTSLQAVAETGHNRKGA